MTHIFRSPKYQKELRKRNKSDQAISNDTGIPTVKPRAPDPGLKPQAPSSKPRYTPTGILMVSCKDPKPEPSSGSSNNRDKLQAPSGKP